MLWNPLQKEELWLKIRLAGINSLSNVVLNFEEEKSDEFKHRGIGVPKTKSSVELKRIEVYAFFKNDLIWN